MHTMQPRVNKMLNKDRKNANWRANHVARAAANAERANKGGKAPGYTGAASPASPRHKTTQEDYDRAVRGQQRGWAKLQQQAA